MSGNLKLSKGSLVDVSYSQQQFYFIDKLYTNTQPLNVGISLHLTGVLNENYLIESIRNLSNLHEQLHTTFQNTPDGVLAEVFSNYTQPIEKLDFTHLNTSEVNFKLKELENYEITLPFDTSSLPLLRATIVKINETKFVLILVNHHITGDGHSFFKAYLEQLSELYNAKILGLKHHLNTRITGYYDYLNNHNHSITNKYIQKCKKYWTKELSCFDSTFALPMDKTPSKTSVGEGSRFELVFPSKLSEKLNMFSIDNAQPNSVILLSAFFLTLYRWSSKKRLMLGMPISNRGRENTDIFGPIMSTLPIGIEIVPTTTFTELMDVISAKIFKGMVHSKIPVEQQMETSSNSTDVFSTSVYQCIFNYMPFSPSNFSLDSLQITAERLFPNASWPSIVCEVEKTQTNYTLAFNYDSEKYSPTYMKRFAESFFTTLDNCMRNSESELSEINILRDKHIKQIDKFGQGHKNQNEENITLHKLVERQLDIDLDKVAVICGSQSISRADLEKRSNMLARTLQENNIKNDDIVAIYLNRGVDMVVALLATLKSGAAYLPIDPTYPIDRIDYVLSDSKAKLIITSDNLIGSLNNKNYICININNSQSFSKNATRISNYSDTSLAYVIYTSGSTGQPKGVMVEHKNVSNFILAMDELIKYTEKSVWLSVTSISFDISVLEIFWSLSRGVKLVLQPDILDTKNLVSNLLVQHKVTHFQCTPSQARMLMSETDINSSLHNLDYFLLGGEMFPSELVEILTSSVSGNVINMYGPTETTIWSTFHIVNNEESIDVPIGNPILNTTTYILDNNLNKVPQGVTGELYIGGEGVVRGYLNRPELTRERFIKLNDNTRVYRTGDLAKYREDGQLLCLGRTDNQVKIRGYRIELGEIESQLLQIDGIEGAAVKVTSLGVAEDQLVAYLEMTSTIASDALRSLLAESLPEYMLPSMFIKLDSLPITPNGKIDRNSLPEPELTNQIASERKLTKPRNDTEIRLLHCWQKVLGQQNFCISDNFFELGGHSILSLQLAIVISKEFGVDIQPIHIFSNRTITEQASMLLNMSDVSRTSLVYLQKKGDGIPIYCVCGISIYQELAELLGDTQKFIAMYIEEEVAFLSGEESVGTVQDLARVYFNKILENHDRTQPLRLIGFCFGGALAYEVACIAKKEGVKIDQLIMLDTILWTQLKRNNIKRIINIHKKIIKNGPSYLKEKLRDRKVAIQRKTKSSNTEQKVINSLTERMTAFVPSQRLDVNAIMVTSSYLDHYDAWKITDKLGWDKYINNDVERINAIGGHTDILKPPSVGDIANKLKAILNQTE